ncbi:uncharacterized protein LOC133796003 [Humulus lupulus]|uniref:uncharacterized protein LOC133796003 n=1 Tax=Humulus lupulus TaxID=3486 RepID=UPI002B40EBD8|nr:uncharacterized protein LOC133796003 [Humulus lupulus]
MVNVLLDLRCGFLALALWCGFSSVAPCFGERWRILVWAVKLRLCLGSGSGFSWLRCSADCSDDAPPSKLEWDTFDVGWAQLFVLDGFNVPEDKSSLTETQKKALEENQQNDSQALFCLQQAMADAIFPQIMGPPTAKEAWDTLQKEFQGTIKARTIKLQKLRRDFENLKMKDNETAKDHYSRIREISKINPRSQKSKADGRKSLENFKSESYQEKQKENNDKYSPCGICKRKSHLEKDYWFKEKPQSQNCKKFSHTEKTCCFKKSHQANFLKEKNDENNLFYVCQAASEEKDTWYLDSGCSNYMTKNESIFCSLDKSKTKVKIGNGDFMEAVGKGTIVIDTKKGKRYINDVLLVPNINQNLLSVGQMVEKGYFLHFEGDSYTIYDKQDKSFEIAKIKMKENICFPLQW